MSGSIRERALKNAVLFGATVYLPFYLLAFFLYLLLDIAWPTVFGDVPSDLVSVLWHAIEISVACTLGVSTGSYFAFRNLYDPEYSQASAVDRFAYIDVQLPYQQAFDCCLASLNSLGKPTILLENRVNGRIEAVVKPARWLGSWRSWGQRVSFRVGSDQEGSTKVLVTSRIPLPGTITGVDTNKRNVEGIATFLREEAEKQVLIGC